MNYPSDSTYNPTPSNNDNYLTRSSYHNYMDRLATRSNNQSALNLKLTQCEDGPHCEKFRCPYRHAYTYKLCIDSDCKNYKCKYMHSVPTYCKYGYSCGKK
ncbi:hypothetical protein KGF54_000672 [Candida jiufengensis]|uniref:uncharacterized protein n=1 Tax=Candida jiufengensis TaxID=497108 RepID=UPI002225ABF5|nr:uncharacterized protein KGF54_000672 [Candida jiufengensis]KAI5956197.1 hypothetical protein KGF54_000672 [Candida jiufengensis]